VSPPRHRRVADRQAAPCRGLCRNAPAPGAQWAVLPALPRGRGCGCLCSAGRRASRPLHHDRVASTCPVPQRLVSFQCSPTLPRLQPQSSSAWASRLLGCVWLPTYSPNNYIGTMGIDHGTAVIRDHQEAHVPELPKGQHLHRPTGPREATEVLTGGPVAEGCGFQRPG
jgi:hypothetical protein